MLGVKEWKNDMDIKEEITWLDTKDHTPFGYQYILMSTLSIPYCSVGVYRPEKKSIYFSNGITEVNFEVTHFCYIPNSPNSPNFKEKITKEQSDT